MFLRIWFMINYKSGPQKLPQDGLCWASNVLLGRRHTFLKTAWPAWRRFWKTTPSLSLLSGAGAKHGTHAGRGETCPGLSTDVFRQGKHQERYHEKAWLQVGVANLGHVWACGRWPFGASISCLPWASCWCDYPLVWERKPTWSTAWRAARIR